MNQNPIEEFYSITGNDTSIFFKNVLSFFSIDFPVIKSFYLGKTDTIESKRFFNFHNVNQQCKLLLQDITQYKSRLNNARWFEFVETIEQINDNLQYVKHINRWSRSNLTKFGDNINRIDVALKQKQSLEKVAQQYSSQNWYDIAFENALVEEDYDSNGGNILNVQQSIQQNNVSIESIVDVINQDSIKGKDLNRKLTFINDDLDILSTDDTPTQSVDILIKMKKNSNPDYPNDGLQYEVVLGGNRALFNFPVIKRQLDQVFSTDDSLKNFFIQNYNLEQDNVSIDFTVETRVNEQIYQTSIL